MYFNRDERSARIGEPAARDEVREEFPRSRVREAGLTGAETPERDRITADDAAPETLLDEEGGQTPADQRGPRPAESVLRVVGEPETGLGAGRDEAEDARHDPISPREHRRIRARVARAGGPLEPAESAMRRGARRR